VSRPALTPQTGEHLQMTIAIDSRWETMLDTLVREGRYAFS
jgi:hypothetical protein